MILMPTLSLIFELINFSVAGLIDIVAILENILDANDFWTMQDIVFMIKLYNIWYDKLTYIIETLAMSLRNFSARGCNEPEVSIIKGRKFLLFAVAISEYLFFFSWKRALAA